MSLIDSSIISIRRSEPLSYMCYRVSVKVDTRSLFKSSSHKNYLKN